MNEINETNNEILSPEQEKARALSAEIAKALDNKKARNIKIIETAKRTILADYFIISTGTSSTHIRSLADEVEFQLKKVDVEPIRISGLTSQDWIIMDYGDVIVHIFNSEARDYYKLEKLWAEGENVDVDTLINELKG